MVDVPLRVAGTRGRRGRVRRPSGEPPPLPRHLERWDYIRLALSGVVLVIYILLIASPNRFYLLDRIDIAIMDPILENRSLAGVDVMKVVEGAGAPLSIHLMRVAAIVVLLVARRFRPAIVVLLAWSITAIIASGLNEALQRERPYGVEILGTWSGYSHPSLPVVALAAVVAAVCIAVVPRGWPLRVVQGIGAFLIVAVAFARVYLGSDHPSDVVFGALISVTIVSVVCRLLAPEQAFPVVYRRGRTAHLALDDVRTNAIRTAIAEQLGFDIVEIKPFGLAGSAGSTPMRLTVKDPANPDRSLRLFAKLYARNHVRSDRWYKLGREIRYGRLEDESSFSTVRRLVQYEDYLMRVMNAAGAPVVATYGIVEITPEREYVLVTEFLDGAKEIGDESVEVSDKLIDEALQAVRLLWNAGVAHRDVKPANVMVQDDHIVLIDVAFGQVRPSAWREAVDLANMMLILALKSDAYRVYRRATMFFSPDEIAEAFAATHGVTIPTQLRAFIRADGRDLVQNFRDLAPERPVIAIQRWTLRRIGLLFATGIAALFLTMVVLGSLLTIPS
jgi:membrane-associated phospholipid phosphatase